MKKLMLILFLFTRPAFADLLNSDFENGTLSDWTTIGDALAVHAATFGTTTSSGQYQALMTTAPGNFFVDHAPFSGNPAIPTHASLPSNPPTPIESFLGLGSGTLLTTTTSIWPVFGTFPQWVYEFSAIKQSVTANAGDIVLFEWNYLTNDSQSYGAADFAVVVLDGTITPLRLSPNIAPFASAATGYRFESHNNIFQLPITTPGQHLLGFAVIETFDGFGNSALLVDNITITAVPEPSTLVLLTIGLLSAGIARFARIRKVK